MSESRAYAIRNATLKVVSEDGTTILGDVENVEISVDNGWDSTDTYYGMDRLVPTESSYTVTADFVPDSEGVFLKVISPKTKIAMSARVEIKDSTLPAISAAHKASGAPDDAEVEVVNLEDQWLVTFTWEENK